MGVDGDAAWLFSREGRHLEAFGQRCLCYFADDWFRPRAKSWNPTWLNVFVALVGTTHYRGFVGDPYSVCANAGHDGSPNL
jgi:hypothetical protein